MDAIEELHPMHYQPDLGSLPLWPTTVEAFFADKACTIRSDYTRSTWGYSYRRLQRLNPGKPVGAFTTDDLVAYITQRNWDGLRWAPLTARNHRTAVSSLFGWAHLAGRIPLDPSGPLSRLVKIRPQRARHLHWLDDRQIARLLAATESDDLADRRDRVVLLLGVMVGLRTGEISRLRWRNVDLRAGVLRFVGKGSKPSTVTLPDQLVGELDDWRALVLEQLGEPMSGRPVVCAIRCPLGEHAKSAVPKLDGAGVDSEGLARLVHARGELIGIPDLRPHDLRRTLAGMLDDQGAKLQDVRQIMRHERIGTTEAYLQDNPRRVAARMRSLTLPT